MKSAAIILCIVTLGGCANAAPRVDVSVLVDEIARRYVKNTRIVGFAVAVSRDGRIVHEAGYGRARLSPDADAAASTPFELFSVGKSATAALALVLDERGLVDLDVPAGRFIKDLDDPYVAATLRQLLRHSSGIREATIDEVAPGARFLKHASRSDLLAWIAEGERIVAPDETWLYNGAGFVVAAMASEQVTATSYAELVRKEFAAPLGLRAFGYCPELNDIRSAGYTVVNDRAIPIPPIDFAWFSGAGSLCGTVGDLLRWWTALRNGRFIRSSALAEMFQPVTLQRDGARAAFGYGLGARLGNYSGRRMIGHTGNGAGGTSVLVEYPDDGFSIAVATNTAGSDVPHALEIQAAIARAVLGIEFAPPARESIAPQAIAAVTGYFRSPEGAFCIGARDGTLTVATEGEEPEELLHQGRGIFRRGDDPASEEFFLNWPNRAQWFGYSFHGFPMDLAMRVADSCP